MTVLIDRGKIMAVLPTADTRIAGGTNVVDGRGKYVVPGYLDMHAHVLDDVDPTGVMKLMLVHGITGFRQMSGSPELLARYRRGIDLTPGQPEILAVCGTILGDTFVSTPDAAAAEVRRQKAEEARFIKVVELTGKPFFAALAEAGRQGLPLCGHLHPSIDARAASKEGMRAIEHLGAKAGILVSCASNESALRKTAARKRPAKQKVNMDAEKMKAQAERAIANPILAAESSELTLMRRALIAFDEGKARELAAEFASNGTWQVPTLIRLRTMDFGDDALYRGDPRLAHLPVEKRRMWEELGGAFSSRISGETKKMLGDFFALQMRLVKLFDQEGVPMLAGSDYGGQWLVPGYSLHQEFDLLAEAGLSPLRILQMTTLNGAKFLGRENEMGSVASGKNADLVILDANPLDDIRNMHKIYGVVREGRYFSQDMLRTMEQSVTY